MTKDITKFELKGICGEYYVAAELSKRDIIATLTLKNTRGVDILASNLNSTRTVAVQVKSTHKPKNEWLLKSASESFISKDHFYVFVRLNKLGERPDYFIVPSAVVAEYVKTNHSKWLSTPGKNGKKRNDSTLRKFKALTNEYLDAWELLDL